MGNKALSLRQEQAQDLRQGLEEQHLQHLTRKLTIASEQQRAPTSTEDPLDNAIKTIRITKEQCRTLFNDTTTTTTNKRKQAFDTALASELHNLASRNTAFAQDPKNATPPPHHRNPTTISFYQCVATIKALVKGNNNQLVAMMTATLAALQLTTVLDRVQFCQGLYTPLASSCALPSLAHLQQTNDESRFHYLYAIVLKHYLADHCLGDKTCRPLPLPATLLSNILLPSHVFLLAMSHPKLLLKDCASVWQCLYSDQKDGTNFNTFCDSLIGYDGPTLVVVQDTAGHVFGMLTRDAWEFGHDFYGRGAGCCLFQLAPDFQILTPQKRRGANTHYQWLNSKNHRKDLPHGIGMGGSLDYFRFFITPTFKNCVSRPTGLTYDMGQIASQETFDVGTIEVWGCGGAQAAAARLEKKEEERLFQESRRKVDKRQLVDGFATEFLLSETFKHRAEQNDR